MRQSETLGATAMSGPGFHHRDTECMAIHCTRDGPSACAPRNAVGRLFLGANLPGLVKVYKKIWKITIFNG